MPEPQFVRHVPAHPRGRDATDDLGDLRRGKQATPIWRQGRRRIWPEYVQIVPGHDRSPSARQCSQWRGSWAVIVTTEIMLDLAIIPQATDAFLRVRADDVMLPILRVDRPSLGPALLFSSRAFCKKKQKLPPSLSGDVSAVSFLLITTPWRENQLDR